MVQEFRREYLVRLPLPLAQLYSRAHNAKDARSRHDNTFYLCEALVKLAAAPAVACYVYEIQHGHPRSAHLDRLLAQLALPSLGQWVAILRELGRDFRNRPDAAVHPLGHLWQQLNQPRRELADVAALFRRIKNGPDGRPTGDQACSLLQLIEALVQYRNAVFGHGGPRFESFYAGEMGPLLFPAVNAVLGEGVLDYLGPPGSRLVYLTELRTVGPDRVEVGLRELVGLQGERLAPLELSAHQVAGLLPNRVAVLWPGRPVPLRLDPLLQYRESETAEEVLFLNRDRNGRQVEYLSYTTGRTERDQATAPALAALLSLIVNREVTEADLRNLAEQSLAETPSVESLLAPQPRPVWEKGDYEILAEIGRGGMGVVFLARQLSLGRVVALKMLPADLAGDELSLARFRREIRSLARCEHPHIVKILASGTMPEGELFYTMEYVPGSDLEQVWRELAGPNGHGSASTLGQSTWTRAVLTASRKRREQTTSRALRAPTGPGAPAAGAPGAEEGGPPPPPREGVAALPLPPLPELPSLTDDPGGYVRRVVQLVRDAALALQAVHEQQIVHRDVKPANLVLTPDASRVVLMDFGLAKGQSLALTTSQGGGFLGTMRYAAPEQLAAATLKVGPAADVRTLGVVLWELLTRRRLFADAQDEKQLAAQVHEQDVPLLRKVDPALDRDLEAIVARATERRVADRIQTAAQMAEYLQLYLDGRPLPIRPPTTAEMVWRWVGSHKPLVASVLVAAAAILVTVATAFVLITTALDRESRAHTLADQRAQAEAAAKRDAEAARAGEKLRADAEARAKVAAQRQKAEADKQRAEADRQKNLAELQLHRAETNLYFNNLTLAQREWSAANVARANELLDQCPVSLRSWEWYFLKRRYRGSRLTLDGHTAPVTAVAFSPDGLRLASGGADNTVRLWDADTGAAAQALRGHTAPVTAVAFSPDGTRLASASKDGTVRVWDPAAGRELRSLLGHKGPVTAVAFSPDGRRLISAGDDDTARVWDPATGQETATFKGHDQAVLCLTVRPDGKRVVSGGRDHYLRIWDPDTGQEERNFFSGNPFFVAAVAYSPDGRQIASAGWDNAVRLWEADTGKEGKILEGHTAAVTALAFSPDGKHLASGSLDRTLRVWNPVSGQEERILQGHTDAVAGLAFNPDGGILASAGNDQVVKVWSLAGGPEVVNLAGHTATVNAVAFSADGRRLASAGFDHTVRLWDPLRGRPDRVLKGHGSSVVGVAFSPDAGRLASASLDGTVKVWDLDSGQVLQTCKGHKGGVNSVAFSPDGLHLASGGDDQTVKIWDAATGREEHTLRGHRGRVTSVAYSPDGKYLASTGSDRTVKIWNLADGREERTLTGHTDTVWKVAFSPDGQRLATGGWDKTVRIWDVVSGREVFTLRGHTASLTGVAFSRDGRRLVTTGGDQVKVWEPTTGQEILSVQNRQGPVLGGAFSPDQQRLALACEDKQVEIWLGTSPEAKPAPAPSPPPPRVRLEGLNIHHAAGLDAGQPITGRVAFQKLQEVPGKLALRLSYVAGGRPEVRWFPLPEAWSGDQGEIRFTFPAANSDPDGALQDFDAPVLFFVDLCLAPAEDQGGEVTVLSNRVGTRVRLTTGIPYVVAPRERATLKGHTKAVLAVAFAPGGKTLASAGTEGTIKLWDVAAGKEAASLAGHREGVRSLVFAPDGQALFSGSFDKTIKVWDPVRGQEIRTLEGHTDSVLSLALAPGGQTLASASADGTVKLWDVAAGKLLATLQGSKDQLYVAWSADGKILATVDGQQTDDDRVKLWDVPTRKRRRALQEVNIAVLCLAFVPNRPWIALGGGLDDDGQVKLYDLASREEQSVLRGHKGMVYCLAFSPDTRWLATGSHDGTLKLWDWARGKELASLEGHQGAILSLAFAPDGKTLATAGGDGTVKLWDLLAEEPGEDER